MIEQSVVRTLRRFHRWLALLLFVFLGFIGLTGAILQAIMVGWGEAKGWAPPGHHAFGALPSYIAPIRQYAYFLHTGGIAGFAGNFYSILCALGLLYFTVSGFMMYYNLYVSRRILGRNGLFWPTTVGAEKTWRSLHRWLAVVVGVFMLLYGLTATSLNIDYIRFGVYAGSPAAPNQKGGGGPGGQWHDFVDYLHKLDFLGKIGHVVGVLAGLSLVAFSITGILLYYRLYLARGKRGYFW